MSIDTHRIYRKMLISLHDLLNMCMLFSNYVRLVRCMRWSISDHFLNQLECYSVLNMVRSYLKDLCLFRITKNSKSPHFHCFSLHPEQRRFIVGRFPWLILPFVPPRSFSQHICTFSLCVVGFCLVNKDMLIMNFRSFTVLLNLMLFNIFLNNSNNWKLTTICLNLLWQL